jgi:hypothetical protein
VFLPATPRRIFRRFFHFLEIQRITAQKQKMQSKNGQIARIGLSDYDMG